MKNCIPTLFITLFAFVFLTQLHLFGQHSVPGNTQIEFGSNASFIGTWNDSVHPAVGKQFRYADVAPTPSITVDAIFSIEASTFPSFSFDTGFPSDGNQQLLSATWGARTGGDSLVRAGTGGITYDGNSFNEGEVIYTSNSRFATETNLNDASITNFTVDSGITGILKNAFVDLKGGLKDIGTNEPDASNTGNLRIKVEFVNPNDSDAAVEFEEFQMTFFDIDGGPFRTSGEYLEVTNANRYIVDSNTYLNHTINNSGNLVAYADTNDAQAGSNSFNDAYNLDAAPNETERQGNTEGSNELDLLTNGDGVDGLSAVEAIFNNISEFEVTWGMYTRDSSQDGEETTRGLWMDGGDHVDLVFDDPIVVPEASNFALITALGLLGLLTRRRYSARTGSS